MSSSRTIELLAPAKNAGNGLTAINFGADAVYIGAPKFSARAAAGNEVADIERLAKYAHQYHARVFIALNTILFDNELDEVQKLIWQLYHAGADALIIQDMGILEMNLPPIELHASTQTNNYDLAQIQFFEKAGFSRIILARELSLEQIRQIRQNSQIELESFVFGALCVSLSGQCYMSQAIGGRSGNRGVCAQPCRKLYDLLDSSGNIIVGQKHLLSLKDLDLSDYIGDMAGAGISSFKIEGRLKDENYLKNTTAFFRRRIDALLGGSQKFKTASSGNVYFDFVPDLNKTFSRGVSSYFLNGRSAGIVSFDTPKSAGEFVGTVLKSEGKALVVNSEKILNNNDGLSFFAPSGELQGAKINTANGNSIMLSEPVKLKPGTKLFRNYDHQFSEILRNSRTQRKIGMYVSVSDTENGIKLLGTDEDGISLEMNFPTEKIAAMQPEKADSVIKEQLSKSGDSVFQVNGVDIKWSAPLFLPVSKINQLRRDFLEAFLKHRVDNRNMGKAFVGGNMDRLPIETINYQRNVSNNLAYRFYEKRGAKSIEPALEVSKNYAGKQLMAMKHCLKLQLGYCPHEKPAKTNPFGEPFFLDDGIKRFRLEFDCKACQMNLYHL